MQSITVKKDELRAKISANAELHQKIFVEAVEGYKNQAVQILEEHIHRIRTGSLVQVSVSLPMPVNHVKDYERALTMIDMAVGDEIEIDDDSFREFVMDDWGWKREFLRTNSAYSATGMGQFKAADAMPTLYKEKI